MSAASDFAGSKAEVDVDRNLALLAYALLFLSAFMAGAPALVAVAIAYARRTHCDAAVKSHFRFQIFVFWVAFALTAVAALCGLGALLTLVGEVLRSAVEGRWDSLDAALFSQMHVGVLLILVGAAALFAALAAIWLIATAAYGFIRLASRRSISQTAP
jgi:uncharacterized membrane protein